MDSQEGLDKSLGASEVALSLLEAIRILKTIFREIQLHEVESIQVDPSEVIII